MKIICTAMGIALLFFTTISTADHLLHSSQEIQRINNKVVGIKHYCNLIDSLYNTKEFPKIHAEYFKCMLSDPSLKYYLDQIIIDNFNAHMHNQIAQLMEWQTKRDTRHYLKYYDSHIKSIIVGCTLISLGCLLYDHTDLEVQTSARFNGEVLKLACTPLFWGLGYFILTSGIHPAKSIINRIEALDKNYKILFPHATEQLRDLIISDKYTKRTA